MLATGPAGRVCSRVGEIVGASLDWVTGWWGHKSRFSDGAGGTGPFFLFVMYVWFHYGGGVWRCCSMAFFLCIMGTVILCAGSVLGLLR